MRTRRTRFGFGLNSARKGVGRSIRRGANLRSVASCEDIESLLNKMHIRVSRVFDEAITRFKNFTKALADLTIETRKGTATAEVFFWDDASYDSLEGDLTAHADIIISWSEDDENDYASVDKAIYMLAAKHGLWYNNQENIFGFDLRDAIRLCFER